MTTSEKQNPRKAKDMDEETTSKAIKFASLGDISAIRRLRLNNFDLSLCDYDDRTALHLAASNGHLNVVRYLMEKGGLEDVNPLDRWASTPYDDAVREGHREVVNYLKGNGGKKGSECSRNNSPSVVPQTA